MWHRRAMQSGTAASMKYSQSHGLLSHRSAGQIYVDQRKLNQGKVKGTNVANGFSTELTLINAKMTNGQYLQTSNNASGGLTSSAVLSKRFSQRPNHCKDLSHLHSHICDDVRQPLVSRSPDGDFEACNIDVHCADQVGLDRDVKLTSLCNENYSGPDISFQTTISDKKGEVGQLDIGVPSDRLSSVIKCAGNEGYSNELTISPISEDNHLLEVRNGEEVSSCTKPITDISS